MAISKNLKALRKSHNLKQEEIAKILGIGRSTYANYEAGTREPDIETLKKIAKHYKSSIDFIVETYKT